MNNYYHTYKGIVIQNDDPTQLGRIKVFVPEISMTLFKDWNSDKEKDKKFTELGGNLGSSITPEILDRLKKALPWAMVKQPIFGCTATLYHNDTHTAIIGDDEDNSVQHNIINKELDAFLPQNNIFSSFATEMQKTASSPTNAANALNFYQNTSSGNPLAYVQNSAIVTKVNNSVGLIPSGYSLSASDTPSIPNGNISQIIITFQPNSRNSHGINPRRTFNTTASVFTKDGPILTGNASAIGVLNRTTNTFVLNQGNLTTNSTITTPSTNNAIALTVNNSAPIIGPVFNAPTDSGLNLSNASSNQISIIFNPNARNAQGNNRNRTFDTTANIRAEGDPIGLTGSANAKGILNSNSVLFQSTNTIVEPIPYELLPFSPPITYSISQVENQVNLESGTSVTFNPNARNAKGNNRNRTFTSNVSVVTYDGEILSTTSSNAKGHLTSFTNSSTSIHKSQIESIHLVYYNPNMPVDLSHPSLGQIGLLLTEYHNNSSVGIVSTPIVPPTTVNIGGSNSSGDSTPSTRYNRGGGGSDLFSLVSSALLPLNIMKNTLKGQANPDSLHTSNYKRPLENGTDPHKRTGLNLQTPVSCLPVARPPTQGNKAKGMLSIPEVGAHVSVYFDNGNPMTPIVDGVFYTRESMMAIHDCSVDTSPLPA